MIVTVGIISDGEYKVEILKNGERSTMRIDATDYDDAVTIASHITGCVKSDIMLPVTRGEIDEILDEK